MQLILLYFLRNTAVRALWIRVDTFGNEHDLFGMSSC